MGEKHDYQHFKPNEIARSFPETAETLFLDTYLTDEVAASARVFRVYRETPPHYHAGCDEYPCHLLRTPVPASRKVR
jgi:hypothetical protein